MQGRLKDLFISYDLIKRLGTPFEEMDAFKLGIIDKDGNFIKKRQNFTSQEKEQVTRLDTIIINLKKIAGRFLPGKLGSYAAALYLLRESQFNDMDEDQLMEFQVKLDSNILFEEEGAQAAGGEAGEGSSSPTNTQSSGRIDLTPIVRKDKYSITYRAPKPVFDKCVMGKCKKEKFEQYIEDPNLLQDVRDYAKKYPQNSIMIQSEEGTRIFLKYGKVGSYGIPPRG